MAGSEPTENLVCPACTCACDDVSISVKNEQVNKAKNACSIGENWFQTPSVDVAQAFDQAKIEKIANQLLNAKFPLVSGLDGLTAEAQQVALDIARKTNAVVDTTCSHQGRASQFALQRHGKVTATLGEISSRSDLIMFVGCDPLKTHPRFIERYCKSATKMIVIDVCETETAKQADQFINIGKETFFEFASQLRMAIAEIDRVAIPAEVESLASTMTAAKYGSLIYGHLEAESSFGAATDAFYQLVRELNLKTRFVSLGLRTDANALSAENVLASATGFASAIRMGQHPTHNRTEYSAESILRNRECDAALICSSASLELLPESAQQHLQAIDATILPNQLPGISDTGEWCRMDDVPLPLRKLAANDGHQPIDVLQGILTAISNSSN